MTPDDRAPLAEVSRSSAAETLLDVIAGMLRELRPEAALPSVGLDDRIERDLGLDSLSRVELMLRIERAFGVRLPERLATAARTPRDLLDAIAKAERGPRSRSTRANARQAPAAGCRHAGTRVDDRRSVSLAPRAPSRTRAHPTDRRRRNARDPLLRAVVGRRGEVARGLRAAGIVRGDAVALMLPTGSAFFQAFLGAMRIGAVPVPLYPPLRWAEIEEHVRGRAAILANAVARVLVTVPEAMFVGQIARAVLPHLRAVVSVDRLRSAAGPATRRTGVWRRYRAAAVHVRKHRRPEGRHPQPRQPAREHPRDGRGLRQ